MCRYCEEGREIQSSRYIWNDTTAKIDIYNDKYVISIYDNNINTYDMKFEINYCPKCGRKLGEN